VTGPLAGVKVLDLSQVIAGPYGPTLLSHSGAEVIKIEPLQGEMTRQNPGVNYFAWNRGKRSLPLNLRNEAGRAIFYRLVERSDVVVENFRPGVTKRLEIDYETLSALNPRLIYASITAFGSTGPYAHRPGFDPLIQAMSGIERLQGGPGNPPVFLRIAITDFVTAMLQAATITMALFNRERTGRGDHIELSLLRSGIFINGDAFTRYEGRPQRLTPDAGQLGFGPLDRMYKASDGEYIFLLVTDEATWSRLVSLDPFGRLGADARFASAAARSEHAATLAQELEATFATAGAAAWLETLETAGVPCAPVITGYEKRFFEDVQPLANGYFVSGRHPERGQIEQAGNYIRFSDATTNQDGLPGPILGQHTEEILREMGYVDDDIVRLREAGAIL
jgi:crotonobetainyl-CoA:carnitine CoA-transferase CaiB-like acyl-CoA transferase